MTTVLNVEPTAKAVEEMADLIEAKARDLRGIAQSMRVKNDLTYAAEAANVIATTMGSLRIDLLITRPLRELGVK